MSAAVRELRGVRDHRSGWSALSRVTGSAIFILLAFLLVEALFESWILVVLAQRSTDASGTVILELPAWVKTGRNGVYIAIALLTVVHIVTTRSFRRFMTPADIAFGILALALIVIGMVGGSSFRLTAEGVFVYLRAAIVFYAIRAIAPAWPQARAILWLVGGVIVLNAIVAAALVFVGPAGYASLGFVDMEWANSNRAQALQSHPNHLGHIAGLAVLGLLAGFATSVRVRLRWWLVFGLLALALALTQSRESLAGVLIGIGILGIFQRGHIRSLAVGTVLILAVTAISWTMQPGSWETLVGRLRGVITAVEVPSGSEAGVTCDPVVDSCTSTGLPRREMRVLYMQQGIKLWSRSPLVGYGVGQFGGAVASQNDPLWYENPRFGPDGFSLHGFVAQQVDSFWLHLLVETGIVGSFLYVAWFGLLARPSVVSAWRARRTYLRKPDLAGPDSPPGHIVQAIHLWAIASIALGLVVAIFSPALEDPLFAPLLMAIIGLAWVMPRGPAHEIEAVQPSLVATPL